MRQWCIYLHVKYMVKCGGLMCMYYTMSVLFPDRVQIYTEGEGHTKLFELCTKNIPHMVCDKIKNNTLLLLHVRASVPGVYCMWHVMQLQNVIRRQRIATVVGAIEEEPIYMWHVMYYCKMSYILSATNNGRCNWRGAICGIWAIST